MKKYFITTNRTHTIHLFDSKQCLLSMLSVYRTTEKIRGCKILYGVINVPYNNLNVCKGV